MNSDDAVVQRTFVVRNELGLHARPAALFVRAALRFGCDIRVVRGRDGVNGKSIVELLTLGVEPDEAVAVQARGADAEEAMAAIAGLFESNFGG